MPKSPKSQVSSPRRPRPARRLFFSHVPMAVDRHAQEESGSRPKSLNEILPPRSPRVPLRRVKRELSEVALTDADTKQFLRTYRRRAPRKRKERASIAWPEEVLQLVKSVFGIRSQVWHRERDVLFHTVAQIARILRGKLPKREFRKGRTILKCLVQDYQPRNMASWRPWLLLLLHEGGYGPEAPNLVGGKVARRFDAHPPEAIKARKKRKDFTSKYKQVLKEYRLLPARRMQAVDAVKEAWADRLRRDLEEQALEETDGLDVLAQTIQEELKDTGQKAVVKVLGQRKYELAHGPRFKEELRKAAKRKRAEVAGFGPHVEIDSDSASEQAPDCGVGFGKSVDLVDKPQLSLCFRVTENLTHGNVGHYRFGLHYDTRFDQVVVRICRARNWQVRDVMLMAERRKGDFVVHLSDTPALRGIRRNSVIDMYYTTPPWRKNFRGRAVQPVTDAMRDELQKYWFRTRGAEDITVYRQSGVVADEDCLCTAACSPKKPRRLRQISA